nr:MAG TPA: hypothetical protein [Caudoviricetes sp.]
MVQLPPNLYFFYAQIYKQIYANHNILVYISTLEPDRYSQP